MNPNFGLINPDYIRLSGEIADRPILSALRGAYPRARIVHAYASTEAGVGFEVVDEQEGFPASFLGARDGIELRLRDGSLHIRSSRTASAYVGRDDLKLRTTMDLWIRMILSSKEASAVTSRAGAPASLMSAA